MTATAKPVALITGGAKRIGASIARHLHEAGIDIALHYRNSHKEAEALKRSLEQQRRHSVFLIQADLCNDSAPSRIKQQLQSWRGRLDILVNNASSFYPTPVGSITQEDWDSLVHSNMKGPLFLAQTLAPLLKEQQGSIVNLVDIYAERPLKDHTVYSMAKAGNAMMVKSLALELAPDIRVNGISPGAILWPEQPQDEKSKQAILNKTPLNRLGETDEIAKAVLFLATQATYTTGQILAVDGGRSLNQ